VRGPPARKSLRNWWRTSASVAVLGLASGSCGDGGPLVPAQVTVAPGTVLVDQLGVRTVFSAHVHDRTGVIMPGAPVTWASTTPSVMTIDAATGVATARGQGVAEVVATSGPVSGTASYEVYLPPDSVYEPGHTYFGRWQYVEYHAGDLSLVLSAPHGGFFEPVEISDRTWGTTVQDRNTQEMARAIAAESRLRTGHEVHLVVSHLHRIKLDPNREIVEAAQGNPFAEYAWQEFHDFIDAARTVVAQEHGSGIYVDLHGHGHEMQRLEWGYLLSAEELALSDAELNHSQYVSQSSIRTLALVADSSFAALLRGPTSLGGLLESRGYLSVPSPMHSDPGDHPHYSGGYNAREYGSRDGSAISGVQLELHWTGVRDSADNRAAFSRALAGALEDFFLIHYEVDLGAVSASGRDR